MVKTRRCAFAAFITALLLAPLAALPAAETRRPNILFAFADHCTFAAESVTTLVFE